MMMDGAQRQSIIRHIWPRLVDFLSDHSEWVLKTAERLLPQDHLRLVATEPDLHKKGLLVLEMVLRGVDANPEIFRNFTQSVCMEFSLPMDLEVTLMSISEEGSAPEGQDPPKGCFPLTSRKVERRRAFGNFPNNNGKESKQKRFDAAEKYSQRILSSMCRKYGISHSAEAPETKNQLSAFSQNFVHLVIHQSKPSKLKVGKEKIKEEPMAAHESKDYGIPKMNLSELFKSAPVGITQVVLLLGKAGMGKSWLAQKICQQWAEGVFPQFKWIFFFEFKQLNLIKRKLTLQELLFDYFLQPDQPETVFQFLLENAQQTLVILDSLGEFMDNIDLPPISFTCFSDLLTPRSVSELVANLCHGKLLPGCTVLITSQPKQLPKLLVGNTILPVEIWGFDREKVEEYVGYFFQQPFQKEQALALLNENGNLLSMCYIPVLCHIICVCLEHLFLEDSESVQLPQTRTRFYLTMLQTFLCKHQGGRTLSEIDMAQHQAILADLCELAFKGLEEKEGLFDAGEVPKHVKDFSCRFGLLLSSEEKMGKDPTQANYTFAHFSWQEFLAALFLLTSPRVDGKMLKEYFLLRKKWILKKETRRMPFTENSHVFLSGLSSQECRQFLCSLAGRNEVWIQERQSVIRKILQKLAAADLTGPRIVELSHCVYETQDIRLAQHVAKELSFTYQFKNFRLMPFDMVTLAFLINGSPQGVCLDFDGCHMELDYLDIWGSCENIKSLSFKNRQYGSEFARALCKTLPKIKLLTTFQLTGGNLKSPGFEDLVRVLPNCHQLEQINLQDNRLKEQDMIKLAEIFPTMEKLKTMEGVQGSAQYMVVTLPIFPHNDAVSLSYNEMSAGTVLAFSKAAANCPKVSKLQIRKSILKISFVNPSPKEPRLKDEGINEEEIAPKPRSLILQLQDCQLDSQRAEELVDILQHCSRLSEINLSDNQLGDEGCRILMTVVSQMCISGPLNLSNNQLSLKSIFYLLDLVNRCPNVVKLEVSIDQQIAVLTFVNKGGPDATQSSLAGNHFHHEDPKNLCLALRSELELDLSNNSFGDAGVLKILNFIQDLKNLNSLILDNNQMSPGGVISLLEFFSGLEHITSVHLGLGSTQRCHLRFGKQISLEGCTVGLDTTRLFEILTKYSGLAEINFSGNSLNDEDVKQMVLCLPDLSNLRFLSIRDNVFSSNGICLLANSFNQCRRISEVDIRSRKNAFLRFVENQASEALFCRFINCGIDQPDLAALCTVFENCDHLAELDLSGNDFDNEGLRWIFGHLPKIQNSCSLKINHNGISPDGVLQLVNFLATKDNVVEVHASLCSEKMLLITLKKQDKPQKILSLKECNLQAEHLAQLLNRLEGCTALSNFISINNDLSLRSAKTLLRSLRRSTSTQKISIEEPWVTHESFPTLLSLATEVQGEVITIIKSGSLFMLEQKFPPKVGNRWFGCSRTSHTLLPDAEGPTSSDALVHFPALQKLWLTDGRIPLTSVGYIAEILQRGFVMEDISFSNSELSLDDLSILLDTLEGKYHLKSINFGSLNFDSTTILKLSSRLSSMPLLKKLGLSHNQLNSQMSSRLAEALKTTPQLEEIDLSYNNMGDAGVKEIAMVLPGMKNVKLINFSCNTITSAGGQWIVEGLIESERLEILKLSGNSIGNKTLENLGPILPYKKHLKVLHLSRCQLDSEGLGHLAGILARCPQMEEINLSENNIGDKGVMSLMTPWPQSSQLRKIELKACNISDRASKTLIIGLSCCLFLEEIVLAWNKLGDETARELAMVLPGMIRVKILDLDKNSVTASGASNLARQLFRCPGIQTIRLWHNSIPKDVEQELADQEPQLRFAFL